VVPVDQTPPSRTSSDSIAPVARQSAPSNSVTDEIFGDSPTTTPFSGSQLDAVSSPVMADTLADPSEPSPLYANDFDFAAVETQYESESDFAAVETQFESESDSSDPLMPDFMQNDDIFSLDQPSALRAPSPANDVVEPKHLQNVTAMAQSPSMPDLAPAPGNMQNDLDSLSQSSYGAGMPVSSPAGFLQPQQATGSTSMASNSVSSQSSSIDALPGISGDVVGASAFPAAQTISGPMATTHENCVCETESAHRDL
jgi:hypothetical protein